MVWGHASECSAIKIVYRYLHYIVFPLFQNVHSIENVRGLLLVSGSEINTLRLLIFTVELPGGGYSAISSLLSYLVSFKKFLQIKKKIHLRKKKKSTWLSPVWGGVNL